MTPDQDLSIPDRELRIRTHPSGASRTKQEFSEECDINVVLRKWAKTGMLEHTPGRSSPTYGDFSSGLDYRAAVQNVLEAKEDFNQLPARIRERFLNSPEKLLEFISNPDNQAEGERMGLFPRPDTEPLAAPETAPIPETEPPGPDPT